MSLVLWAALSAYVATAGWLVWRTSILQPFADMFDWLERWDRFRADGDLARYLWAPHNFHHLVWTLAVLGADVRLFGGQGYLFLTVGVLCWFATAAILVWLGARTAGPGLRLVGAAGGVILSLMGCDVLDATTDIDTTYVHALVFAVAAIWLDGGTPGTGRRVGAIICAAAAGLGSAAGLAVWPALVFAAWRDGQRRWLFSLLAASAICAGVYLVGESGAHDAGSLVSGPSIGTSVLLSIDFLALPWIRAAPRLGAPIGGIVLAISFAALAWPGRARGPAARTAEALIVFSLGTAAMTALARAGDTPPALVPMRYSVFLIPLHVGLWLLALPWISRVWRARPKAANAAAVVAAALLLGHQVVAAVFAVRTNDLILGDLARFREGRTPVMPALFGTDLGRARAIVEDLKRRGLYQRELRPDPPSGAAPGRPASPPATPGGSGISASSPGP